MTKISTHEPYFGPPGNLDTLQADRLKPPVGSPIFSGMPQGGPTKGNTSPLPATFDLERVKTNISDIITNPATSSPLAVITMQTSDKGKQMIASFEKYVPFEYPDGFNQNGKVRTSIGYGHQLSGATQEILNQFSGGVTEEEAWKVLTQQDLPKTEIQLKKKLRRPISQNQFDAFVSFVFNRGIDNPAVTNAINSFNKNDMQTMAGEFMSHPATAGGKLINRREAELDTFFKGNYKITNDRAGLKKIGLKEFILEGWQGEHLWKLFPGFLHKEFPNEEITQRVVNQAALVYDRSEKQEYSLPPRLPNNKLTAMVGGETQLQKRRKTFINNFDSYVKFLGGG